MTDAFRRAVVRLLDRLDGVAAQHGEVHDTMVREMTFGALYRGFLQDEASGEAGGSFGLFSDAGNAAVADALNAFLADPAVTEAHASLATPQARLDAFQARNLASGAGSTTDEYFGYVDSLS